MGQQMPPNATTEAKYSSSTPATSQGCRGPTASHRMNRAGSQFLNRGKIRHSAPPSDHGDSGCSHSWGCLGWCMSAMGFSWISGATQRWLTRYTVFSSATGGFSPCENSNFWCLVNPSNPKDTKTCGLIRIIN